MPKEKFDPDNKPAANRATLPKAIDVVRAYNRRVADISRMRTPVSAVIDVPRVDESGKLTGERQKDQLDGNLQFIQPDRVSLRMDKVQQTVFSLGSGGGKYWFITMGDEPVAYTGSMSNHPQVYANLLQVLSGHGQMINSLADAVETVRFIEAVYAMAGL
jgi:hypothetical protein